MASSSRPSVAAKEGELGQRRGGASRRHSQVVRQSSAKAPFPSSNLGVASIQQRSLSLTASVEVLSGITPAVAVQLQRLGIRTVRDLLRHYPYRYEDLRAITPVAEILHGPTEHTTQDVNLIAVIADFRHQRLPGRMRSKTIARIEDGTGALQAVWFGRPYLANQLGVGMRIFVRGKLEYTLAGPKLTVARHRVMKPDEAYEGRLIPVYPQTAGLQSHVIGRLVRKALTMLEGHPELLAGIDPLPASVVRTHRLGSAKTALHEVHAPRDPEAAARARRRLVFEEFFLLGASSAMRRAARQKDAAPQLDGLGGHQRMRQFLTEFRALLPFDLTNAQRRVIDEILADMARRSPMNRLLQGDVGCGKTIVATAAMMLAARAGCQSAFMAPTEVLAVQQFEKIGALLSRAGVRSALVVGALKRRTRDQILEELRHRQLDVVVGTHALITDDVKPARLGLVIIDEQHRFGVLQRAALRAKANGRTPHTLIMTATPIPRTLAQSVYADLDVSIIDELPPGRMPVRTFVRFERDKPNIFDFIRTQLAKGRQAYIVCPAIDDSERALHSAVSQAEQLKKSDFAKQRVALLHGRMTGRQKEQAMHLFADGLTELLITTSMVEVGVDVPNASVMLVLDAQSFGLAQLHQLRGRVGRGAAKSYCILVARDDAADVSRLSFLASTNDGFEVAEEDLKIRGIGELSGTRQHGVEELRMANLIRDFPIYVQAKKDADALVAADPTLSAPENAGLSNFLAAWDHESALRISS